VNDTTASRRRHRVVIVGSGFGGLFAAKALKRADVDVTMIARTNHHLFQPLLYQVATGILSQGEIAPPIREILRRQRNARVLLGEVTDIDIEQRVVTSWTPWKTFQTPYDSLIVAAGSTQSYFGHEEFAEFAPGMKSIDDALELRGRILGAFEFAELETDPAKVMRWLTFVIVGAGPTGVEMAGQIAELSRRTLRRDFRNIDPRQARIVLLDAAPQMLGNFGDRLSAKAQHELEKLGVEVQLGSMVVGVDEDGLEVKDADGATRRIESWCKVWAAGVGSSPLGRQVAEQTGAKVDKVGRVFVEPDCTLPGHPEVFVIGDMIAGGLPGVAQVAMQSGRHAAKLIKAGVEGRDAREPFEYHDKGSMATIARFDAVASIGKLRLSGFLAWLAWLVIHLFYLIGFKQRLTTLLHWAVSFVGRGRAERTVTRQQVVARRALDTVDPKLSGRPERIWPPPA
jgi:NADH:ubiquinone reductase (H+-translocating)